MPNTVEVAQHHYTDNSAVTGVTPENISKLSDADLIAGTAQQYIRARESYKRTREEIRTLLEFGNAIVARFKMERVAGQDRDGQLTVREAFEQADWSYDAYRMAKSRFNQNLLPERVRPTRQKEEPVEAETGDIEFPPAISHDGHIRGGKPGYFDIPLTEQEKLINFGRKMAALILNPVRSKDCEKRLYDAAQQFIKLLGEQKLSEPTPTGITINAEPPARKGRRKTTKAVPTPKTSEWKSFSARPLGDKFTVFKGGEVEFTIRTAQGTIWDTMPEAEAHAGRLNAKYAPKAEAVTA